MRTRRSPGGAGDTTHQGARYLSVQDVLDRRESDDTMAIWDQPGAEDRSTVTGLR